MTTVNGASVPEANSSTSSAANPCPPAAIALLCAAFGLALVTAWGPTFEHLSDPAWSEHQRFHAFREIFLATVFSIAGIALCVGPLRKGRAEALPAVAVLGLGVVAGFWVGLPITGIGKAGFEPYLNHGVQVVAMAGGWLGARRAMG